MDGCLIIRKYLATDLSEIHAFRTIKREAHNKRVIMVSFLKARITGMIIHKGYLTDSLY